MRGRITVAIHIEEEGLDLVGYEVRSFGQVGQVESLLLACPYVPQAVHVAVVQEEDRVNRGKIVRHIAPRRSLLRCAADAVVGGVVGEALQGGEDLRMTGRRRSVVIVGLRAVEADEINRIVEAGWRQSGVDVARLDVACGPGGQVGIRAGEIACIGGRRKGHVLRVAVPRHIVPHIFEDFVAACFKHAALEFVELIPILLE